MYGLVNKAMEDLVRSRFGDDVWDELLDVAGLEEPSFLAMETYDDSITHGLIAAGTTVLGLTPDELLFAFGEHWIGFTLEAGYGDLIGAHGSSLEHFLVHLNDLHARIKLTMPQLNPPCFQLIREDSGSLLLTYLSMRSGFAPMVSGALSGLARRFDTLCEIEHLPPTHDDAPHRFRLRVEVGAAAHVS